MSADDFWTVNGSRTFGIMPGRLIESKTDLPICLQRGTPIWGSVHIERKHRVWLRMHRKGDDAVPWLIWQKCQQSGTVWTTESSSKYKVMMQLRPSALLVFGVETPSTGTDYLKVITLYPRDGSLDGTIVGRYVGQKWRGPNPTFAISN